MFAELSRIVNEDISPRVNQYDVIIEAITNAIHANATNITCIFKSYDGHFEDESGKNITPPKIHTITVRDNGDGIDDNNYTSFCKYRSEYKKDLGARGVGRLVFLKVYESAKYKSQLLNMQEERNFVFDFNFDTDKINKTTYKINSNFTEVVMDKPSINYLNSDKKIDRRIELDLDRIKEIVLVKLIPTLFFYKKKGVAVSIEFLDETTTENTLITPTDVPDFETKQFTVKDKKENGFPFNLNYKIEKKQGKLHAYYCANNRTVEEFAQNDFKLSLPHGFSGFLLLESNYFDERINHERNTLTIYPAKTDMFSTLSWEMINSNLKNVIAELIKTHIPETETANKQKIQEIHDERPYLINYIEDSDIDIAVLIDKKQIIDQAKKRFDKAKEHVFANADKREYTDAELVEAINITQDELVAYIFDRAIIIERLKTLIDKKERVEKIIHDLFMEQGSEDDYFCVGKNNLWLLDDRFTTYSYAASNKIIKEILKQINEEEGDTENLSDKPDLSLFFSKNPQGQEKLKSVIIEIKPFDYLSKPDRKKYAGIQQLIDYVKAFKNKEKIEEAFAFLVTDVDEKLAKRLTDDNYIPIFSVDDPIYYRYYNEPGISIYVISAKSIVNNAEARNKIFLDIAKKQCRLKKILTNNGIVPNSSDVSELNGDSNNLTNNEAHQENLTSATIVNTSSSEESNAKEDSGNLAIQGISKENTTSVMKENENSSVVSDNEGS